MAKTIERLKDTSGASLDMPHVFSVLAIPTRLTIMEELERQGLIPFTRFKELLNLDNESTLNNHLDKLAKAQLIRKSPHVHAWELTEQGSKLLHLVDSMRGETRQAVGPTVNIIISGTLSSASFSEVENMLRSRRSLQTISRTHDSLSVRLDDQLAEVTLEIRADGQFTAKGKLPLTSIFSVTKAGDLRMVEEQFVNFFNLIPEESKEQPAIGYQKSGRVQSWILMANGLVWSLVYFLLSSALRVNPQSTLTSIRYWADME